MAGPAALQQQVEDAWQDAMGEFIACLGEPVNRAALDAMRKLFDRTIRAAIENHGVAWEEPIRSYALRHICQIAKEVHRCRSCGIDVGDALDQAATVIFDRAEETCKRVAKSGSGGPVAQRLGVLCGRA